jgi:hypothetical protein
VVLALSLTLATCTLPVGCRWLGRVRLNKKDETEKGGDPPEAGDELFRQPSVSGAKQQPRSQQMNTARDHGGASPEEERYPPGTPVGVLDPVAEPRRVEPGSPEEEEQRIRSALAGRAKQPSRGIWVGYRILAVGVVLLAALLVLLVL